MYMERIRKSNIIKYISIILIALTVFLSFIFDAYEDAKQYVSEECTGDNACIKDNIGKLDIIICESTVLRNTYSEFVIKNNLKNNRVQKNSFIYMVVSIFLALFVTFVILLDKRFESLGRFHRIIITYIHNKDGKKARMVHFS